MTLLLPPGCGLVYGDIEDHWIRSVVRARVEDELPEGPGSRFAPEGAETNLSCPHLQRPDHGVGTLAQFSDRVGSGRIAAVVKRLVVLRLSPKWDHSAAV